MDSSKRGRAGRKTFNREDEAEMKEQGKKVSPRMQNRKGAIKEKLPMVPARQRASLRRAKMERRGPGANRRLEAGLKQRRTEGETAQRKGEQMNGTVQERP